MPINFYTPTFRQQVNPIDLNVLARTYNTLEQGHQQAIQTKSQIDAQLAQLDLNEAEDAWRQEQLNKVRNALTENMQYGNAYSSLDDIVGTYGDITSSPGMIGRLRAQQDYKAYMDNLDKRTDLSEDYKNYYRAINKYNYQDITDKNGNVIGGSKWTPIDKEVSEIPMNQILNQALQWAAKEQGGGSQTRWLDVNGKVTDDITKSVTGEIYSHTKGDWQRLSKAKLAEAVKAVIENTPGAKASLEQDYKIAKWKYDQNGSNPDITDKNGILLTPEQYLAKRIDPFYNAATFYNQDSDTTYGEAWKAQLALAKQAGLGSTNQRKQAIDNLTYKGTPVRIDNFMPAQAQAEITSNRQSIAGLLNKYNPDINIDLATANPNDIRTSIMTNITSPSDRAYALSYLNDIIDNQEYINSLKVGKSQDSIDGFDTYNSIISLSDLPNNKYSDTYSKYVNQIFGDSSSIRQYFNNDDVYNSFINALGGEKKAISLGIRFGSDGNGYRYAELPKDYHKSIYSFGKAVKEAEDTRNPLNAFLNSAKTRFFGYGDKFVRVDSNGEEHHAGLPTGNKEPYIGLVNYVDSLKSKNDAVLDGGKITSSTIGISALTPELAEINFMMNANPEEASKLSAYKKNKEEQAMMAIRSGIDLTQGEAYITSENGVFEPMTSEDRKSYTAYLRSAKENEITPTIVRDPKTGDVGVQINIAGYYDTEGKLKREPITLLVGSGAIDSSIIQSWNQDTSWKAAGKVENYYNANRPISLTNNTAFTGIDKFKLVPNGGGFNLINSTNNQTIGLVSKENAVDIVDNLSRWEQTVTAVKAGMAVDENAVKAIQQNVATKLAQLSGSSDPYVIQYYYDELTNNLY
ncbi:MAG: hypothetical protein [Bacteriophage sp.]|nr:MAG: hypothetical protein [Bacteriophage sp.]